MDNLEFFAERSRISNEPIPNSLLLLYEEGLELPDRIDGTESSQKLETALWKINAAAEHVQAHLFTPERFAQLTAQQTTTETERALRKSRLRQMKRERKLGNRSSASASRVSASTDATGGATSRSTLESGTATSEQDGGIVGNRLQYKMITAGSTLSDEEEEDALQLIEFDSTNAAVTSGNNNSFSEETGGEIVTTLPQELVAAAIEDAEEEEVTVKDEIVTLIYLEATCAQDIYTVLEAYRMEQGNALFNKIVYYSATEKKSKSITLFDQIFLVMCKCQILTAFWNSAHEPRLYALSATDFPFARQGRLCMERRAILDYNVKDLFCAISVLSERWPHYCIDLERYIWLLQFRVATLVVYAGEGKVHNMARFRSKLDDDVYVANADFIELASCYFYSYTKRLKIRLAWRRASLYDLDVLFNQMRSQRLIALFPEGPDTNKLSIPQSASAIDYESRLGAEVPLALLGPETTSTVDEERLLEIAHAQISGAETVEAKFETFDELRLAYLINDEVVKFLNRPHLLYKMLEWLQARSVKLHVYGEETMRKYHKMCLHYSVMVGEDLIYFRKSAGKSQAIEQVLKSQRGVRVFNRLQEALNKDAHKILPDTTQALQGAVASYPDTQMNAVLATRNPRVYAELRNRASGDTHASLVEMIAVQARPIHDDRCGRAQTLHHIPEFLDRPAALYKRTQLTEIQEALAVLLINSYFDNYFQTEFESEFVIYENEVEEKYDSYTRAEFPMLVQSPSSGFSLFYRGIMYEIGHFLTSFFVWMRLMEKFHGSTVNGYSLTRLFGDMFGDINAYIADASDSFATVVQGNSSTKTKEPTDKSQSTCKEEVPQHVHKKRKVYNLSL